MREISLAEKLLSSLTRIREFDKLPGAHLIGETSRFWIVHMFIVLL
jgi:curved DNA-binding protein CbpA